MKPKSRLTVVLGEGKNTATVKVRVFPSITAMLAELAKDGEEGTCKLMALTHAPYKGRKSLAVWFAADALKLMYIAHESVHVAYAIGRWGVNPWQSQFDAEEEERIAYPTGEVCAALTRALMEAGWHVSLT